MNTAAFLSEKAEGSAIKESPHVITKLPVLVMFPHNRCNCRCLMCDIWKIRQTREITVEDLQPHLDSLRAMRVRWIVFSGGEPLLHSDLPSLCEILREKGIRLTLLTAGLLLERKAMLVAECFDDLIVSLDGPPKVHDTIRNVPRAFELMAKGIGTVREIEPGMVIQARCTVQRANRRHLRQTILTARDLQLNSVSFLAADITSEAFNRPGGWDDGRQAAVALEQHEVEELTLEVEALIAEFGEEIDRGFVTESAAKLRRIVHHFEAHGHVREPLAPPCNAPWVSAVIEADGSVRPCFFHPAIGNIHDGPLTEVVNSEKAVRFRRDLDVPTNPTCRSCVCSLYLSAP